MSQRPTTLPRLLPNGAQAVVPRDKIRHYCLSREQGQGQHKARIWLAVAGFGQEDAVRLQTALRRAAREAEVLGWKLNGDGSASWQTRLEIDLELTRSG